MIKWSINNGYCINKILNLKKISNNNILYIL